ncbi:hypothetical protein V6N12_044339 [Hibiscus sabdariffa]|uniref:hAT-like transposase RNase-H fold domain-containing protein n=1 Tax=Hibiscus sabdariffa TaxID=183260 RepID=A0ABR2DGZ4_9ROSI
MLCEWGLERKAFTITLDNASANERMVKRLKDDLNAISPLPCNDKYFHIRCAAHILNLIVQKGCAAHILNLIVQKGLKVIDSSVIKLRKIVKFIDSSDARLSSFDLAVKDCGSSFFGKMTWILFLRMWETASLICDFLEPFFEITTLFSGSKYPTSNLYLANVVAIEKLLCDAHNDPCEGISAMAGPMLELYEKYWSDHSTIMSFAVLLDPRYKLQLLKELYSVLYVEDEVERRNFDTNLAASRSGRSDVDSYISLPLLPRTEDAQFDILEYWKS